MDLDNFKHINDTLGHAEGDKVLVAAADIFRTIFRQSDILGRLGGDEFVVLITDENDTGEEFLKARLERSLHEFNSEKSRNYKLSISIGMSVRRPDAPCSVRTYGPGRQPYVPRQAEETHTSLNASQNRPSGLVENSLILFLTKMVSLLN
jgi:hypothetical protein